MLTMLRTRKWIALTFVALLTMAGFGLLSHWQWERAERDMINGQPPVPLTQVVGTSGQVSAADYGRRVVLSGIYRGDHQVLVRRDPSTFVVVTPLTTAAGLSVAVARGTTTTADDPLIGQIPAGTVTVSGTIQPFDGDPGTTSTLPPGQVSDLTAASIGLEGIVGGWVALVPAAPGFAETPVGYGPHASTGLRAQNVTYAIQWILFAGCVVFFWWRLLRDDVNDQRAHLATSPERPTPDPTAAESLSRDDRVEESASNPSRKKVY